jgi:general secretion pathway protein G
MTLIEIMIVLAIIALVMGVLVGPGILRHFRDAQRRTARMMLKQLEGGWTRWRLSSEAECPAKLTDLNVELGNHANHSFVDPWGHAYVMKCGDSPPPGCDRSFCVYSFGPDGQEGTGDDLTSWDSDDPPPPK